MVAFVSAALRRNRNRNRGAALAAAGGVLLVGAMFLDWYALEVSGGRVPGADRLASSASLDAWQAFQWSDLLLLTAAVLAVASAVFGEAASRLASPGVVGAGGTAATILILWRLVDPPLVRGEVFTFTVDVVVRPGALLGLLGALLIMAGSALRIHKPG